MKLVIIRHAKAILRGSPGYDDDMTRPLTDKGFAQFTRAARWLGSSLRSVDAVFCSPAVRTAQTAELLAKEAKWPQAQTASELSPGSSPADVLTLVSTLQPEGSYVLVGHEPMMSELVSILVAGRPDALALDFKPGAAGLVDAGAAHAAAGNCTLNWFVVPKLARGA